MPPTPKTMCALNIHFQIVKMWGHLMVMPCDTRWWHEVSLPSLYHLNAITEIPRVNEKPGSHGQDYRPPSAKKPSDKLLEYECPYCHVAIYSTVESGNVKTTGHCGKQFRVRGGVVARSFDLRMPQMWPADSILEGKWQNTKHAQDARWKHMYQSKLGHQIIRGQLRRIPPP